MFFKLCPLLWIAVFAVAAPKKEAPPPSQLSGGYNYPAGPSVDSPMHLYADGSFLFWQAFESNLLLGLTGNYPNGIDDGDLDTHLKGVQMDCEFHPGFRLEFGGLIGHDNWDLRGGYTWFHATNEKKISFQGGANATEVFYPAFGQPYATDLLFNQTSGQWHLGLDLADVDLGRWYYIGTKLELRPSIGFRAAWISQVYQLVSFAQEGYDQASPIEQTLEETTHSWGLGPKLGLEGNWNIYKGWRLFGNSQVDLLYTRYTKLRLYEKSIDPVTGRIYRPTNGYKPLTIDHGGLSDIRTHVDLLLGLGWNTFLHQDRLFLDLSLGYEMQVFFDQNMFFSFGSSNMTGDLSTPNGNLYLHGMTLKALFAF